MGRPTHWDPPGTRLSEPPRRGAERRAARGGGGGEGPFGAPGLPASRVMAGLLGELEGDVALDSTIAPTRHEDLLPQPYRFVDTLVAALVNRTMDEIDVLEVSTSVPSLSTMHACARRRSALGTHGFRGRYTWRRRPRHAGASAPV